MMRTMLIFFLILTTPVFAAEPQPAVGGKMTPVVLSDAQGQAIDISRYLGAHPLLIAPVYFRCPNICSLSVGNLLNALDESHLAPGRDLDVVVFSFNPKEGPKDVAAFESRMRAEVPALAKTPLHFLTGSAAATTPLLASLGARAVVDADTGQFAHPAAVAVVAPDGRVTAWLSTLSITPRDLHSAVGAAQLDRTFSLRDFIVTCFHSAVNGAHDAAIRNALRIGGLLTIVLILVAVTWLKRRRERQP